MMVKCTRCQVAYSHSRSTSALVLTYCSMLCEVADLGYSLSAFEKAPISELLHGAHVVPVRQVNADLFAQLAA